MLDCLRIASGLSAIVVMAALSGCSRPAEKAQEEGKSVAQAPGEKAPIAPKPPHNATRHSPVTFDEFEEFLEAAEEPQTPKPVAPAIPQVPEDLGGVFAAGSDAAEAGRVAIELHDQNGDGALGGQELEACPALASAIDRIDGDGDGQLTAEEIAARIESWKKASAGRMDCACRVTLDGQPLAGATVAFEAESFLPPSVRTCRGVTDEQGIAIVGIPDADPPGAHPGFYKVKITHETIDVPARYNTETTLGVELAPDVSSAGLHVFKLEGGGGEEAGRGSDTLPPEAKQAPPAPPVGKPLRLPEPGAKLLPIDAAKSDDPDNPFLPEAPREPDPSGRVKPAPE
jgi:hypothetical protein